MPEIAGGRCPWPWILADRRPFPGANPPVQEHEECYREESAAFVALAQRGEEIWQQM